MLETSGSMYGLGTTLVVVVALLAVTTAIVALLILRKRHSGHPYDEVRAIPAGHSTPHDGGSRPQWTHRPIVTRSQTAHRRANTRPQWAHHAADTRPQLPPRRRPPLAMVKERVGLPTVLDHLHLHCPAGRSHSKPVRMVCIGARKTLRHEPSAIYACPVCNRREGWIIGWDGGPHPLWRQ